VVNRKLANFISIALHPFLVPTYFFLVIIFFAPAILRPINADLYLHLMALISITSFFIPALLFSSLRFTAVISSFTLESKRERIVPILFIAGIYAVSAYLFYDRFFLAKILFVSYFTIALLAIILAIFTTYIKVSLHSAAICGVFGLFYALQLKYPDLDFVNITAMCALVSGWVMSARMSLNAHDGKQVLFGGIIGFTCGFACFYWML